MNIFIKMPMINVNDESADLVQWVVNDGAKIKRGEIVCSIETTKSTVDIEAEGDGFLRHIVAPGTRCYIGQHIGFIANSSEQPIPDLPDASQKNGSFDVQIKNSPIIESTSPKWTKKAEIVAKRLGVDLNRLIREYPGQIVGEDKVLAAAKNLKSLDVISDRSEVDKNNLSIGNVKKQCERVLILGGGGGGELVLDIISRSTEKKAIGILDNDPNLTGVSIMGVPVLGGFELINSLWEANEFDTIISTIVRNIDERTEIYERYTSMGIPFTNIIDPDCRIGVGVTMGQGNLIIYGCYLATGVSLGNNNFLAAGNYIEHHSSIGSHCTLGPRNSFSGKVTLGNKVKIGTHVAIEPFINVGSESVVASGTVLTMHVPERNVVKGSVRAVVRHK